MRAFVDLHGDALYDLHDTLCDELGPWGAFDALDRRGGYDRFLRVFEPHVVWNRLPGEGVLQHDEE
jgi:hypothetical protein